MYAYLYVGYYWTNKQEDKAKLTFFLLNNKILIHQFLCYIIIIIIIIIGRADGGIHFEFFGR